MYVDSCKSNLSIVKNFSISEIERFTGIKAHTIRTWEQRFGIVKPLRTKALTRHYSLTELEEILNLSVLNRNGYKISRLALLSPLEIKHQLAQVTDTEIKHQKTIADLTILMHSFDVAAFENLLAESFKCWPSSAVFYSIIYPFLKMHELLWQGNKLTEEHLVVTVLRSKMIHATEVLKPDNNQDRTVILFLHTTKQLDLALLYVSFHLKNAGIKVIYLGSDVSVDNLEHLFQKVKPQLLYTYLPDKNNFEFKKLIRLLEGQSNECKLIMSTHSQLLNPVADSDKIIQLKFEEALNYLLSIDI